MSRETALLFGVGEVVATAAHFVDQAANCVVRVVCCSRVVQALARVHDGCVERNSFVGPTIVELVLRRLEHSRVNETS